MEAREQRSEIALIYGDIHNTAIDLSVAVSSMLYAIFVYDQLGGFLTLAVS